MFEIPVVLVLLIPRRTEYNYRLVLKYLFTFHFHYCSNTSLGEIFLEFNPLYKQVYANQVIGVYLSMSTLPASWPPSTRLLESHQDAGSVAESVLLIISIRRFLV